MEIRLFLAGVCVCVCVCVCRWGRKSWHQNKARTCRTKRENNATQHNYYLPMCELWISTDLILPGDCAIVMATAEWICSKVLIRSSGIHERKLLKGANLIGWCCCCVGDTCGRSCCCRDSSRRSTVHHGDFSGREPWKQWTGRWSIMETGVWLVGFL